MHSPRKEERVAAIQELRLKYKLSVLLKASGMAKSTYHYYCQKTKIPDKYQEEKKLIYKIFKDNRGYYGYRRITLEMRN